MVYKINPFHASVWHSPSTIQVGLDARQIVLPQLSAAAEKFIDALYFGVAPNQVSAVAGQARLPQLEAVELLRKLQPLLEQQPPQASGQPNRGAAINLDAAFADLVAASLKNSTDGRAVLAERARRAVYIDELNATGLLLMLGLAAAGVGTFVTRDNAMVRSADTGPTSYAPAFLGQKRIAAASLVLQATWPSSQLVSALRLKETKLNNIDVVVFINSLTSSLQPAASWNARQVSQLEIRFDAGGFSVSPVITPGETPCLICRELWASGERPEYSAVNPQLAAQVLRFDHTANRLLAAGIAMQSILTELDFIGGFTPQREGDGGGYEIRDAGASGGGANIDFANIHWPQHPECSCSLIGGGKA